MTNWFIIRLEKKRSEMNTLSVEENYNKKYICTTRNAIVESHEQWNAN